MSYYIIVKDWKVMFKVEDYNVNKEDKDKTKKDLLEFLNTINEIDIDFFEILEKPLNKITLNDIITLAKIVEKAYNLFEVTYPTDFLIFFLLLNDLDFEIISDIDFNKNREKYKDYIILA